MKEAQEKPVCDVCGEEDSDTRPLGKVEVCRACQASNLYEIERLRNVIKTGGALYRAERAAMGIPAGIDDVGQPIVASPNASKASILTPEEWATHPNNPNPRPEVTPIARTACSVCGATHNGEDETPGVCCHVEAAPMPGKATPDKST
jgi:hypothetical protein